MPQLTSPLPGRISLASLEQIENDTSTIMGGCS